LERKNLGNRFEGKHGHSDIEADNRFQIVRPGRIVYGRYVAVCVGVKVAVKASDLQVSVATQQPVESIISLVQSSTLGEFLGAESSDTEFLDLTLQPWDEVVESLPLDACKCAVRTLASNVGEFQSVQEVAADVLLREVLVDADVAEDDHAFQHGTKQQARLHDETLTAQKRRPLVVVDNPDQNACANNATSVVRDTRELAPYRVGQLVGVVRQPEQVSPSSADDFPYRAGLRTEISAVLPGINRIRHLNHRLHKSRDEIKAGARLLAGTFAGPPYTVSL